MASPSDACTKCGKPVNTMPGGDGLFASAGPVHDACRDHAGAAKRENDRRTKQAPLFAWAGLTPMTTPEEQAELRARRGEMFRQEHAAEREARAAQAGRAAALRAQLAAKIDPALTAVLDGKLRALPTSYAEMFWKEWLARQADGRLDAWAAEQRAAGDRAVALRAQVAAQVTPDRFAELDAFGAQFGGGELAELFWRERLRGK